MRLGIGLLLLAVACGDDGTANGADGSTSGATGSSSGEVMTVPGSTGPSVGTSGDPATSTSSTSTSSTPTTATDSTSDTGAATTTTDGDGDASDSSSTGAEGIGPYGDCVGEMMACPDMGLCVLVPATGVCAPPCVDVMDCPPPPAGGTAPAICGDANANGAGDCLLDCSGGNACPTGMTCFSDQICVWR
jgi:hypothetical protein